MQISGRLKNIEYNNGIDKKECATTYRDNNYNIYILL